MAALILWHLLFHVISLLALHSSIPCILASPKQRATLPSNAPDMLEVAATAEPGEQTTNRVMTGRSILARSVIRSSREGNGSGRRAWPSIAISGSSAASATCKRHAFNRSREKRSCAMRAGFALGLDIDG